MKQRGIGKANKANKITEKESCPEATAIMGKIIDFLKLFMPETLAKRLICIVLMAAGIPVRQTAELVGVCTKSVYSFRKGMTPDTVDGLLVVKGGGRRRKLADVEEQIIGELEKGDYHTRQQIADMVWDKFQMKVSLPVIGRLLKKNGIRRLKCGSLPAKADPVKQREFFATVLQPLMTRAGKNEVSLLFMDASHFVMGCDFLGYVYGKVRRFVKTYSGRKRYNVLGVLDFATKKMLTVTNDSYITATEVCEMLRKIATVYAGKTVHLVLDNAKYQKCKVVQCLASELGIQLEYIPPYSPNLNLIERVWKFTKGKLRTKFYDNFALFCGKIDAIIKSTEKENKATIDSLIGNKVQLFDDLLPLNENTYACRDKKATSAA